MRIIDGFKLREVCGESIVVPEGRALVNFNKMISLNETAAYLWKNVEGKDFEVEDLKALLLDAYDVDEQTASRDAAAIARKWMENDRVK